MSMLQKFKDRMVIGRLVEEAFYAQAAEEMSRGILRDGLWAMATAVTSGNELMARSKYISLLAAALKDEQYLAQRAHEIAEAQRLAVAPKTETKPLPAKGKVTIAPKSKAAEPSSSNLFSLVCWYLGIIFILYLLSRAG